MGRASLGGAYEPGANYNRTGGTDTGGTYSGITINGSSSLAAGTALASPVITGTAGSGFARAILIPFVEVATLTTHTGTATIPAGAVLLDIYFWSTVLWTAADAAVVIGDANSANGWFTTCQLDTTDLVVGERLQASNANNWGGVNGAYLTTAGRFGQQSANMIGGYCPNAYSVIAVVTKSGAGSAGRSFMLVTYAIGESVSPTVA